MKLWEWQKGRQDGTNYKKFPLWYFRIGNWGFDGYVLSYQQDTKLKLHRDLVEDGKHWRLNIKLWGNTSYFQGNAGYIKDKFVFFRPDLYLHSLYCYTKTVKLSFGFVKFFK